MTNRFLSSAVNILLGLLFSFIGFVNTFWGNDPYYGLLIILVSLIFYLPTINLILDKIPKKVLLVSKILIGLFILWTSLGVGELFAKMEIMNNSFPLPNH
jgi:hypothetical protein